MFQCIIQQRNGWIHAPSPEMRDVFPGKNDIFIIYIFIYVKNQKTGKIVSGLAKKEDLSRVNFIRRIFYSLAEAKALNFEFIKIFYKYAINK